MSDDAIAYWNAWTTAFGDSQNTQKLLCTWHVLKNWRLQMRGKVRSSPADQVWIWQTLNMLIRESNEAKFRHLLVVFQYELSSRGGECNEFWQYFENYYRSETRMAQWAKWARKGSIVNTNMYLESFHRILKMKFLGGRQNRRMDTLIGTLLKTARWFLQEYAVTKEKGVSCNSHRLQLMHSRHKNSMKLNAENVRYDDETETWFIRSETDDVNEYEIQRAVPLCNCGLKCRHCGVCPNLYFCSCPDAVLNMTACKHMHYVQSTLDKTGEIDSFDHQDMDDMDFNDDYATPTTSAPDPRHHLLETNKGRTKELSKKLMDVAKEQFQLASRIAECDFDDDEKASVLLKMSECVALMKTVLDGQSGLTPVTTNSGPANKLSDRQRYLIPRRAKRSRSTIGPKATAEQAIAVTEHMENVLETMSICSLCRKDIDDDDDDFIDCDFCKGYSHKHCCERMGITNFDVMPFKCSLCSKKYK